MFAEYIESVTLPDGPHRGWTARVDAAGSWTGPHRQTITLHPPGPLADPQVHPALALTIAGQHPGRPADPADPQWTMLTVARVAKPSLNADDYQANTLATAAVLARIREAVPAAAGRWRISTPGQLGHPTLHAAAYDAAGPDTTLTVRASTAHRPGRRASGDGDAWIQMLHRADSHEAALRWLLRGLQALPGIHAAGPDWRTQTAAWVDPRRRHIGEFTVTFTNAINGNAHQVVCADLDQVRAVAGTTDPPYNNTRIDVARLVDVVDGALRWRAVDPALWRSTPVAQTVDPSEPTAAGLAGQFDAPGATTPSRPTVHPPRQPTQPAPPARHR